MKRFKVIAAALACSLASLAAAQDTAIYTNLLKTQIGRLEARIGVVIIKGYGKLGSIPLGQGQLSLRYKRSSDSSTGEKAYGLAITYETGQYLPEIVYADDDEVDPLVQAVDYRGKLNYNEPSLPGCEASYTSKAGLRVIAHGDRIEGGFRTYLQFGDNPPIELSSMQMGQLRNLIAQGRKNLAALKAGKPVPANQ